MSNNYEKVAASWLKRKLSSIEPIFQHEGFAITLMYIYILINIFFFFFTAAPAWRMQAEEEKERLMRVCVATARGGGAMLNLNSAVVILVACRGVMTFLRRTWLNMFVPFDNAMPAFHSFVGNLLAIGTFMHSVGHFIRYFRLKPDWDWGLVGCTTLGITGTFLVVAIIAIRITSIKWVRTRTHETFYYTHHLVFMCYFIVLVVHGSHDGKLETYKYITIPILMYILDRGYRFQGETSSKVKVSRSAMRIMGKDVIELKVPRVFAYIAGQYCDINVPKISRLQWHAFTIASSPHEAEMKFFIKVNGDWTGNLFDIVKEKIGRVSCDDEGDDDELVVYVRGAYGAAAQHVGQFEHIVLVSGGVGATPFSSVSKFVHEMVMVNMNKMN